MAPAKWMEGDHFSRFLRPMRIGTPALSRKISDN
jgi:hypothetical protein